MIRSIRLDNLICFADDASRPGLDILQNGFNYERHVVAELRRLLPTATGFLDIGANIGIHTLIARTINPLLPIVSAECSPANLDLLMRNITANHLTEVTVLPFPLADRPRILRTNRHEPNMCCTLDGSPDSEDYPRLAAAFSLDHLILPDTSVVKIDVEGFELVVLRGAMKLLKRRPTIIFEYCPEITHRSGTDPVGFLQWFLDFGYTLTTLDHQPGMRATFTDAAACHAHVLATSKWIADILAEPTATSVPTEIPVDTNQPTS